MLVYEFHSSKYQYHLVFSDGAVSSVIDAVQFCKGGLDYPGYTSYIL